MQSEVSAAGTLSRGNITYLPVIPGRIEFALRVRRYLLEHRPSVIAIELPSSLENQYRASIQRMPQMSVIVIPEASTDEEERATYIPIEPGDPFIEALRTAGELDAEVLLLEPASHEKPHVSGSYPEPYSVELIGVERYIEAYRVYPQQRTPEIEAHAAAMAWKLQGADPLASVCVVLSQHAGPAPRRDADTARRATRSARSPLRSCRALQPPPGLSRGGDKRTALLSRAIQQVARTRHF